MYLFLNQKMIDRCYDLGDGWMDGWMKKQWHALHKTCQGHGELDPVPWCTGKVDTHAHAHTHTQNWRFWLKDTAEFRKKSRLTWTRSWPSLLFCLIFPASKANSRRWRDRGKTQSSDFWGMKRTLKPDHVSYSQGAHLPFSSYNPKVTIGRCNNTNHYFTIVTVLICHQPGAP